MRFFVFILLSLIFTVANTASGAEASPDAQHFDRNIFLTIKNLDKYKYDIELADGGKISGKIIELNDFYLKLMTSKQKEVQVKWVDIAGIKQKKSYGFILTLTACTCALIGAVLSF